MATNVASDEDFPSNKTLKKTIFYLYFGYILL